jgi:hypothetical protein
MQTGDDTQPGSEPRPRVLIQLQAGYSLLVTSLTILIAKLEPFGVAEVDLYKRSSAYHYVSMDVK